MPPVRLNHTKKFPNSERRPSFFEPNLCATLGVVKGLLYINKSKKQVRETPVVASVVGKHHHGGE